MFIRSHIFDAEKVGEQKLEMCFDGSMGINCDNPDYAYDHKEGQMVVALLEKASKRGYGEGFNLVKSY